MLYWTSNFCMPKIKAKKRKKGDAVPWENADLVFLEEISEILEQIREEKPVISLQQPCVACSEQTRTNREKEL